MTEKIQAYSELPIRLNMKQTSKGEWYGECTVRGEDVGEAVSYLDLAMKAIKERSTIKKEV